MGDEITEKVLNLIASTKKLSRDKVSINSTFEELGLDSLDAINLMFEIETEFDLSVPNEAVRSLTNVRELIEKVKALLGPTASLREGSPE